MKMSSPYPTWYSCRFLKSPARCSRSSKHVCGVIWLLPVTGVAPVFVREERKSLTVASRIGILNNGVLSDSSKEHTQRAPEVTFLPRDRLCDSRAHPGSMTAITLKRKNNKTRILLLSSWVEKNHLRKAEIIVSLLSKLLQLGREAVLVSLPFWRFPLKLMSFWRFWVVRANLTKSTKWVLWFLGLDDTEWFGFSDILYCWKRKLNLVLVWLAVLFLLYHSPFSAAS